MVLGRFGRWGNDLVNGAGDVTDWFGRLANRTGESFEHHPGKWLASIAALMAGGYAAGGTGAGVAAGEMGAADGAGWLGGGAGAAEGGSGAYTVANYAPSAEASSGGAFDQFGSQATPGAAGGPTVFDGSTPMGKPSFSMPGQQQQRRMPRHSVFDVSPTAAPSGAVSDASGMPLDRQALLAALLQRQAGSNVG